MSERENAAAKHPLQDPARTRGAADAAFQFASLDGIPIAQSIARPAALIGAAFLSISLSTNFCK
jgi:hypothetical protein